MKYDVTYFDADDGQLIEFDDGLFNLNLVKFKYYKNEKISPDRLATAFDLFKYDVDRYVNGGRGYGLRDFDDGRIAFDVFTILPFLYLTAEKGEPFQYPIMESPYQEKWLTSNDYGLKHTPMLSGNGRSLILGRYFPEQTIDIVSSDISEGIGGEKDIEGFLDNLFSNSYWNGKDIFDYKIIVNLCSVGENRFFGGLDEFYDDYTYRMLYTLKTVELVDHEYMEDYDHYRPERFIEKTSRLTNWKILKSIIDGSTLETDEDYWELLDSMVRGYKKHFESVYTWKI